MSYNVGPKINAEGLILYYDIDNQKSFKGEPTINLNSDPFALSGNPSAVSWGGYEYSVTRTNILPVPEMAEISPYWMKCTCTSVSSARVAVLGVSGLSTGVDYCISAYVYSDDPGITAVNWNSHNGTISNDYGSVAYSSSDRFKIKRCHRIFRSVAGSQLEVLQTNIDAAVGDIFYITGIQCEKKSYPTPVVNGTRGDTIATGGGLNNLARTPYTSDLINSPLYSTGSILLDGVDEYIETVSIPASTERTVEIVYRILNTSSGYGPLWRVSDWRERIFSGTINLINSSGSYYYLDGPTNNTDKINICYSYNGPSIKSYRNGVLMSSQTMNAPMNSTGTYTYRFGYQCSGASCLYINMNLYSIKFYNRELTADEVKRNYEISKTRFGL